MARQKKNIVMRNTRGMIGKQIVFKNRNGTRYVAAPPNTDENRKPTKNQLARQDRFRNATQYANEAIQDPDIKLAYQKVANRKQSAQNMAFRDAYYPPEILSIVTQGYYGLAGNIIVVNAVDDFKVKSVDVSVVNENNEVVEKGSAIQNHDGKLWIYTCVSANPNIKNCRIAAYAYDIPGNETVKEVSLSE